jgi:hypothetical protein
MYRVKFNQDVHEIGQIKFARDADYELTEETRRYVDLNMAEVIEVDDLKSKKTV